MKTLKQNIPLYYKVYNFFKNKIISGELLEGELLPSERKLMTIFKVSRSTIRQGLKKLENENFIYIIHGSGAFVSHKPLKQELSNFYSFYEEIKKIGKHPTSKVLEYEIINSNNELNEIFKSSTTMKFINIKRLRLIDNEPVIFENTFLPLDRFKNFNPELLNTTAMYTIFKEKYNIKFDKATETFSSLILKDKNILKSLGYKEPSSCMYIKRFTYEEQENIIEYTISYARGDKYEYKITLNNLK